MTEKISVIIPSYNHNSHLLHAVQSALNLQGEKDIIIVDDGSEVPVKNIWGKPVTVLRHTKNKGLPQALNTGIEFSKTRRFVICAADDQLHKLYIQKMIESQADIVSCDMFAGGRAVRSVPGNLQRLMKGNCHSYAALIKKSVWSAVGGFKLTMNPSWEDYEFFLNAAEHGARWEHVSLPLHIYNRNPNGRDAEAQGQDFLLRGKLEGYHPKLFGPGKGVVSFIVPCYNHEQYLTFSIDSCLSQVYPHVRVIVVDDCSPNGQEAEKIVNQYNDERVVYVRHSENKHLSASRNTGIRVAIEKFNSEYILPLDADDTVHPLYIEKCLASYEQNVYVYSDVQFIGDANHVLALNPYDCKELAKRHVHHCSILMQTKDYQKVVSSRGYGYDETMKEGYEDWEWALALLHAGVCGKKVEGYYFGYRFHNEGSMRTKAQDINAKLVQDVKSRHLWTKNERNLEMACKTCGGQSVGRVIIQNKGGYKLLVNVPGVGEVDGRMPIQVSYTGDRQSTITKLGRGVPGSGQAIYRYSANPNARYGPTFTIFAIDTNLFVGPYKFSVLKAPEPVPEPDPMLNLNEVEPPVIVDDLSELKFVGAKALKNFSENGISTFEDIVNTDDDLLKQMVGPRFKNVKEQAQERLSVFA